MALSQSKAKELARAYRDSSFDCSGKTNGEPSRVFGALADHITRLEKSSELDAFLTKQRVQVTEALEGNVALKSENNSRGALKAMFESAGQGDQEAANSATVELMWTSFINACLEELATMDPPSEGVITLHSHRFEGHQPVKMAGNRQAFEQEVARLCMEKPFLRWQLEAMMGAPLGSVVCRLEENGNSVKTIILEVTTGKLDDHSYEIPRCFGETGSKWKGGHGMQDSWKITDQAKQEGHGLVLEALQQGRGVIIEGAQAPYCLKLSAQEVFERSGRRLGPLDFDPNQNLEEFLGLMRGRTRDDSLTYAYLETNPSPGMVEIHIG
ncbi:MAG: hypothetical protein V1760_02855 [Candidatus Peregrinibacteria bacterium]